MAMITGKCPSCQADITLDDEKEYGFCEECGTRIAVSDFTASVPEGPADQAEAQAPAEPPAEPVPAATPAEQSAAVAQVSPAPIDYATSSLLVAANRAFEERNFADAYEKYTKVISAYPQSFEALYRSAICSVYLAAPGEIDEDAFESSMRSAIGALESGQSHESKSYVDLSAAKDQDISNLLVSMFAAGRSSESTQSCLDNCRREYEKWLRTASFSHVAISYIEKESFKETALTAAIDFCDMIKGKEMTYLAGMENVGEDKTKPVYKSYAPDQDLTMKFTHLRGELADTFNNLPSRLAKINDLNVTIQTIKDTVDSLTEQVRSKSAELKGASKSFWAAHPEQYTERQKKRYKCLIIIPIAAVIAAVVYYLMKQPVIYALAIVIVALLIAVISFRSVTKKYDDKVLSIDVKLIQSDLETLSSKLSVEEAALKEKQKALSDFEKTNK